jgi:hypothetical protein
MFRDADIFIIVEWSQMNLAIRCGQLSDSVASKHYPERSAQPANDAIAQLQSDLSDSSSHSIPLHFSYIMTTSIGIPIKLLNEAEVGLSCASDFCRISRDGILATDFTNLYLLL